jgi:hypothetical protein
VKNILRRGLFTDLLIDHVTPLMPATVLLGDGLAPEAGGWTGQEAGSGAFKPYVVLTTGAGRKNLTEPLRGQDTSWRLSYTVRGVGANRQQADFACDAARPIFSGLQHFSALVGVGNAPWHVLKSEYVALGDVRRNDATDPPLFECVDSLEIWLDLGP